MGVQGFIFVRSRAVASVAVLTVVGGLLITGAQAAPAAPPGQTFVVSTDADRTESGSTSLTDDGLTAAYQSRVEDGEFAGPWQVLTRTLPDGTPQLASTGLPDGADAAAPSIAGSGDRVAYTVDFNGTRQTATTPFVTNRYGDQEIRVGTTPVTGLPSDLTYQRTLRCNPLVGNSDPDRCGARLSGDGGTVVWPAVESLDSPSMVFGPKRNPQDPADRTIVPQVDRSDAYLPLFDFGFFRSRVALHLRLNFVGDVTFTGMPTVESNGGTFEVQPNSSTESSEPDCTGSFRRGEFCSITFFYNPPRCGTPATSIGTMTTHADTPAGNTAMSLMATGCVTIIAFAPPPAAAAPVPAAVPNPCTGRPNPNATGGTFEDHPAAPVGVYGEQQLHTVSYRTWTITNPGGEEGSGTVTLNSSGCEFSFDDGPADSCKQGQTLTNGQSCTAYLRFEPQAVAPYAAGVTINRTGGGGTVFYRFSGYGGERVILGKRTGAPNAAPFGVSIGEGGTVPVDGRDPAPSFDGNLIAFTSNCAPDGITLPPSTTNGCGAGDRIFLRDLTAGTTRVVSILPDGSQASPAVNAAISADGTRLAFGTLRTAAGANFPVPDKVFVRDLPTGRTINASAGPNNADTVGSGNPALSRDGSTVGYDSSALNLTDPPAPGNGNRVYVRDLGPDFGGPGAPGNEQISLGTLDGTPVDGPSSSQAALNGDGGIIAFNSRDRLSDTQVIGGEGVTAYARARFGNPEANPTSLTFPTTQVGSESPPQTITISNGGPGPIRIRTVLVGPYTLDTEPCGLLHRDESCTLTVTAVPTEPGPQKGTVTVTGGNDFGPPNTVDIPLTGRAISPLITVKPAKTDFPVSLVGSTSKPITVTVTNVSPIPLTITGAYQPATKNFTVKASTCTGTLAPRASCTVVVTYTPTTIGKHTGDLSLRVTNPSHEVDFTQGVPATGSTRTPKVTISPAVVPIGQVAQVAGTDFPPNASVAVTWQNGLGETVVKADATGKFATPLITLRGDLLGSRNPAATVTGLPVIKGPIVLVVPGSIQPPDFGTRN
jgi:HYDIN/CFA65/VesB family protein